MMPRTRRGMVGIEAAIVLIAFVIVAAALAFVVLNMGFVTTQRSQQVISSGLSEASTALEVDGSVLVYSSKGVQVDYLAIPIKVSPGREAVDLNPNRASVVYWSSTGSFADIYVAYGYVEYDSEKKKYVLTVYNISNDKALDRVEIGTAINITEIVKQINNTEPFKGMDVYAVVVWFDSNQPADAGDTNLELGEKAMVLVIFNKDSIKPKEYDVIKVEIKPPEGATLTVERTMPPGIPAGVIDLG